MPSSAQKQKTGIFIFIAFFVLAPLGRFKQKTALPLRASASSPPCATICATAFDLDPDFVRPLLPQQIERYLPQNPNVGGRVIFANPAGVLIEGPINSPMQPIFDAPIPPSCPQAHAERLTNGPCFAAAAKQGRRELPASAICFSLSWRKAWAVACRQARRTAGLRREKTRARVSWLRMPQGHSSPCENYACFALPYASISAPLSAPQRRAQRAMASIAIRE